MSAPEHFATVAHRLIDQLRPKETQMASTADVTATHEPIALVAGDTFCIEGQCDHAAEADENATETTPCPLLDEVTVCGTCSTVTPSPYGDEWGPVVTWPCSAAA